MLQKPMMMTALSALFAGLSLGAEGGGCSGVDNGLAGCELDCEFSLKADSSGRAYCECLEWQYCSEAASAPQRDPDTGECVNFDNVCSIPAGWQACELETCAYNGASYDVGDNFPAGDGCNDCTCDQTGAVICTLAECEDDCFGAWVDETGACRAPNDGAYPAECCGGAPLCTSTGGTWHTGGCGNWVCGQEMLCGMISTPGCDCGVGKNFIEDIGCADDWNCGVQCDYGGRVYTIGDTFTALDGCNTCTCTDQGIPCTEMACNECGVGCQPGSTCNSCPAHPDCPTCTVCGPPVCEPIVCAGEQGCPDGSFCNFCPESPSGVGCDWIGAPPETGLCTPGD